MLLIVNVKPVTLDGEIKLSPFNVIVSTNIFFQADGEGNELVVLCAKTYISFAVNPLFKPESDGFNASNDVEPVNLTTTFEAGFVAGAQTSDVVGCVNEILVCYEL